MSRIYIPYPGLGVARVRDLDHRYLGDSFFSAAGGAGRGRG